MYNNIIYHDIFINAFTETAMNISLKNLNAFQET